MLLTETGLETMEDTISRISSTTAGTETNVSEWVPATVELLSPGQASSDPREIIPSPEESTIPNLREPMPEVGRKPQIDQGISGHAWIPGVWNSFPHRGIWSLFGCLAGLVASIIVLVEANGSPKSNWKVSPTVYISAFTAITNTLARFSFSQGTRITWWRSALRGSTINDLDRRWSHSDGFWTALFAGRQTSTITLASIAVTIIAIDQPLIQRAVNVVASSETKPTIVTGVIAPEIPWGFTGFQSGKAGWSQLMSQPMIEVLNSYNSRVPIQTSTTGCDGVCTGYVRAGGVAARCRTLAGPTIYVVDGQSPPNATTPFSIKFGLEGTSVGPPQIVANIAYTRFIPSDTICTALRTERKCHLASATLEYPVTLKDGVVTLGDLAADSNVVGFQPMAPGPRGEIARNCCGQGSKSTLGGLYAAANIIYGSSALLQHIPGLGVILTFSGVAASQFLDLDPLDLSTITTTDNLSHALPCKTNWTDPTSQIITTLNTMAFMLSISAATFQYRNTSAPPAAQAWTMSQTRSINVYQTDYRYMVASIVLTTVLVLLVTPTFTGWWELGRDVSLNPIETAKAFDAPLLSGPGSNAPLKELTRAVGLRRVKWGGVQIVEAEHDGSLKSKNMLIFGDSADVTPPTRGTVYG